jgi:hypothetical protein
MRNWRIWRRLGTFDILSGVKFGKCSERGKAAEFTELEGYDFGMEGGGRGSCRLRIEGRGK